MLNCMRYIVCLAALLSVLSSRVHSIEEIKPQHAGKLDTVDVLNNGSVKISGTYEAVDLNQAASQAVSQEEMKDLLHWAIKHSDPKVLQEAAAGRIPADASERKREIEQAIEYMRQEPSEAELMAASMEIIRNALAGEEARVKAFEGLSYLLEPIDNANDLHKLGGLEVLQESLGEHNSKPLRAAAANALAVAASNNEEFQQRLWEKSGRDLIDKLLQIAKLDDKEAVGKGLYALSKLLPNENFRQAFFEAGGLATLQRLLAGQGTPSNVRRKALTMLEDLAHFRDTAQQILQLPERGRGLVREIEQQLTSKDWLLTDKALLALKALARMPGSEDLLQGADPAYQLQKMMKAAASTKAKHDESEYVEEEVQRLAEEISSMLPAKHSSSSRRDGEKDRASEGPKSEL